MGVNRVKAAFSRLGAKSANAPAQPAFREARRPAPELVLSGREFDVFVRIGRGLQTASIAAELGISFSTVNRHVTHVYGKLRVHSVGEAVALAVRKGLA
jgi:DNA-binding CsgD family transcriptional regulator